MAAPLLTLVIGTDYWVLYILVFIVGSLFIMINFK